MTIKEAFGPAVWVRAKEPADPPFYFLRGVFRVNHAKRATLRVAGLGYFECWLNGKPISDDRFLPLNTDYEARENYPVNEVLSGHRILVPEYDVKDLLRDGENLIAIHFGGGWYDRRGHEAHFGAAKAIWRVFGEDGDGGFDFGSGETDRIAPGFITEYDLISVEAQDLRKEIKRAYEVDFPDGALPFAVKARAPETEYGFSDCPPDRVCERIVPLPPDGARLVYDCGFNLTGTPVVRLFGRAGETVTLRFAEEITQDGALDPAFIHGQRLSLVCSGEEEEARARFTWFGFRYFSIEGPGEVRCVETVHTDVKSAAAFTCDDDTLNWFDRAFKTTQLMNMHGGVPSDCPHKERRGYTGDGQLVCRAAMIAFDAERFYRKWIGDILDCQDRRTGHVQYTAPYVRSGGGPGGWGSAIVEVPYQFYKRCGDLDTLKKCYPAMLRYFDYLDLKSVNRLVAADKEGEWCLGEWCTPEATVLPPPFVNNYFYIKALTRCMEIAPLVGGAADLPELEARRQAAAEALTAAYHNPMDGSFLGCRQGANAFAVDIGLGDERTYKNLRAYYEALGGYDTGIFGTEIVTRVLFEHGDGDLAVALLRSEGPHSFAEMKKRGATTIWEYFPGSLRDRSHSHPMFGAVDALLYDHLLGIRQPAGEAGWRRLEIAPVFVRALSSVSGSRDLPAGRVSVSWRREGAGVRLLTVLPPDLPAVLALNGERAPLKAGTNEVLL